MAEFMMVLLTMSLQASLVMLLVLMMRKVFNLVHIAKKYVMLLWTIPFFCLIFPWKISMPYWGGSISPLNAVDQVIESDFAEEGKQENPIVENPQGDVSQQSVLKSNGQQEGQVLMKNLSFWGNVAGLLWMSGVLAFMIYGVVSYIKLKRQLLCSMKTEDHLYLADGITTPMVFGILRPRIYLPTGLAEEDKKYVVAHEKTHIQRGDFLWKMAFFLVTCVHWFNPFVWYAFYLAGKDMEMACDEETLQKLGMEEKKSYANTLLTLSAQNGLKKRRIFVAPLSFDEGNTKGRIKNIMKYRKTASVLSMLAVIMVIAFAVVCLTQKDDRIQEIQLGENQRLSVKLPEGYSLGEYQENWGWAGGSPILPELHEENEHMILSNEWRYAGFVGRIPQEEAGLVYKNGVPDGETYPEQQYNHQSTEILEVLTDMDWPAIFVQKNLDFYTAAGQVALEEQGVEIEDTTGDYWIFYFAKEEEEEIYYLSLSAECFSKEEAMEIAGTVKFVEE